MISCIIVINENNYLGETVHLGERSNTHVYPYHEQNPAGPPRSHKDTCQHMSESSVSSPVGPDHSYMYPHVHLHHVQ